MTDYRELIFYQKAQEVVKRVNIQIKLWPRSLEAQEISRQLFRAAMSVGASIAEGHGRHQGKEYIHYLTMAQGSANEVDHWLHTSLDCNIGIAAEIQQLVELNNEVRKMLNATVNTLKTRQANKTVRESLSPYTLTPSPLLEEIEP